MAQAASAPNAQTLPELASVYWRPRVDEDALRRRGNLWTTITVAHVVPFVAIAVLIVVLQPLAVAVSLIAVAKAWLIPALYAQRGANVVRPKRRLDDEPERRALGLLGDLVGHEARDLYSATGLVLERGALGVWLVGEAGAVLVRPGRRRVFCYCVRVPEDELPSADRTSHLLLALREDEAGFATVANLAFSGARWRLRRRLDRRMRPALAAAAAAASAR
ncbi:MAG: hypothetical protein QOH11_706 [Solirubrobacteraceae bacterium]|nr:hypothetical protein [Solirubrobacteraceae bacterium]